MSTPPFTHFLVCRSKTSKKQAFISIVSCYKLQQIRSLIVHSLPALFAILWLNANSIIGVLRIIVTVRPRLSTWLISEAIQQHLLARPTIQLVSQNVRQHFRNKIRLPSTGEMGPKATFNAYTHEVEIIRAPISATSPARSAAKKAIPQKKRRISFAEGVGIEPVSLYDAYGPTREHHAKKWDDKKEKTRMKEKTVIQGKFLMEIDMHDADDEVNVEAEN